MSQQQQKKMSVAPKAFNNKLATRDSIQGLSSQIPINAKSLNESITQGETTDDEPTSQSVSQIIGNLEKKVELTEAPVVPHLRSPRSKSAAPLSSQSRSPAPLVPCSKSPGPTVRYSYSKSPPASSIDDLEAVVESMSQQQQKKMSVATKAFNNKLATRDSIQGLSSQIPINAKSLNESITQGETTDDEPTSQSVSQIIGNLEKKVELTEAPTENEPTAYPVNACMTAWEKVTPSGSMVSNKIIKPKGNVLPDSTAAASVRPPSVNVITSTPIPKLPIVNCKVFASPNKSAQSTAPLSLDVATTASTTAHIGPTATATIATTMDKLMTVRCPQMQSSDEDSENIVDTVILSGLPANINKEMLELYFENLKKFGGDVKSSELYGRGEAEITFESVQIAQQVVENSPINFKRRFVKILPKSSSPFRNIKPVTEPYDGRTLEVKGLPPDMSLEIVQLYFENHKKSRGGPLTQDPIRNERLGTINITFESNKVAGMVMEKSDHQITGIEMKVCWYKTPVMQKYMIYISNVHHNTPKDSLIDFLERKAGIDVKNIHQGNEDGTFLVFSREIICFDDLQKVCNKCPLYDNILQVSQLPVTTSILVKNTTPQINSEVIELYFGNHRISYGGDITTLKQLSSDCFLVTFEEESVVKDVCSKEHILLEAMLEVSPYYEHLENCASASQQMDEQTELQLQSSLELESSNKYKKITEDQLKSIVQVIGTESQGNKPEEKHKKGTIIRSLKKKWSDLLQTITVEKVNIPEHIFEEVKKKIENKGDMKSVSFDRNNHSAVIKGFNKSEVDKLKERIVNDFITVRYETKEIDLPQYKINLLMADGFPTKMQKMYDGLIITFSKDKIVYKGSTNHVLQAKLHMYKFLELIVSLVLNLPPNAGKILNNKTITSYFIERFKVKNCIGTWELKGDRSMSIYSIDERSVSIINNIMSTGLEVLVFESDKETKEILKNKDWKILLQEMESEFKDLYYIEEKSLSIITIDREASKIKEKFEKFFEHNVIYERMISLNKGQILFLKKFKDQDIKNRCMMFAPNSVKVIFNDDNKLYLSGSKVTLDNIEAYISELIKNICCKEQKFSMPGIGKYLKSSIGETFLANIKDDTSCIILEKWEIETMSPIDNRLGRAKHQQILEIEYCNCMISLKEGDITEMETDAIVNAANSKLEHIGGIAKAIVNKGGLEIQRECAAYMLQCHRLMEGEVMFTSAGKLKCKIIIHAVGPKWEGGTNNERKSLIEAISNSLNIVDELSYTSIAFPAISTGVFNYPVDLATEVIVLAVKNYLDCKQFTNIKQIFFIDTRQNVVAAFRRHIQEIFNVPDGKIFQGTSSSDGMVSQRKHLWDRRKGKTVFSKPDIKYEKPRKWNKPAPPITPQSNFSNSIINLKSTEITSVLNEVIVNTTSATLQLGQGAVSKAILSVAGQGIQDECTQSYPRGISNHEIAITSGYNLRCNKVFHLALPAWKKSTKDIISQLIIKCLTQAEHIEAKTIAFPALGTGKLKYPLHTLPRVMYEAVSKYFEQNKNSNITGVDFVIHPKDNKVMEKFKEAGKMLGNTASSGLSATASSGLSATASSGPSATVDSSGTLELSFGNLTLTVLCGDLLDQDTEGIINVTDSSFNLNGRISKALLKVIGNQFIQDCKATGLKDGYAITKACPLKAKYILHIDSVDIQDHPEKVFSKCFNVAEGYGWTSLALVPIGRVHGCSVQHICSGFKQSLLKFVKSSPQSLFNIKFVIFERGLLEEFKAGIQKEKSIGIFSGVMNYLKKDYKKRIEVTKTIDVNLVFYAEHMANIQKAIEHVEQEYENQLETKEIEEEAIADLTPSQIEEIASISHSSEVSVEIKQPSQKIIVHGIKGDVSASIVLIQQLLLNAKAKAEKIMLQKITQWYFNNKLDLVPFNTDLNFELEKAYSKREDHREIDGNDYFFEDPDNMYQTNGVNEQIFKIIRRDTKSEDLPTTWSPMDKSSSVVELKHGEEYQSVVENFNSINYTVTIQKVERIQNKPLYTQYKAQLEKMKSKNPNCPNETQCLWHGTADTAVDSINEGGFNRSYCGRNAVVYGEGVYFAVDINYSAQTKYSPPDTNGERRIYMCDVLTGWFCQGNSNLRVLPKTTDPVPVTYDSAVDDINNPTIYVIFHDVHAYPKYLITFKEN